MPAQGVDVLYLGRQISPPCLYAVERSAPTSVRGKDVTLPCTSISYVSSQGNHGSAHDYGAIDNACPQHASTHGSRT